MEKNKPNKESKETIDRREALVKTGKYAAFTAAAMMIVMSPLKAATGSGGAQNVPTRLPTRRQ